MSRFLFLIAGAVLLVDGYVYGLWTGRWNDSNELAAATARLDRVPMNFGNWKGEALELEPKVLEQAGFSGYVLRRYENTRTKAVVSLLVACGRSGPLSVHTPEVCYRCAGVRLYVGQGASGDSIGLCPN